MLTFCPSVNMCIYRYSKSGNFVLNTEFQSWFKKKKMFHLLMPLHTYLRQTLQTFTYQPQQRQSTRDCILPTFTRSPHIEHNVPNLWSMNIFLWVLHITIIPIIKFFFFLLCLIWIYTAPYTDTNRQHTWNNNLLLISLK